jgi:large subunit ribosomal protein L24
MNLRKGDTVKIISGNDKGRTGKILAVFPKEGRIAAEGVNIKKKHVRPRKAGQKGELVQIPAPFSVSRAMLICPRCGKAVRVGSKNIEGRKIRACKKCGGEI